MTDYKEKENIIKRMIESIIMPKYPEIEDVHVESDFFRSVRKYTVTLLGDTFRTVGVDEPGKISDEIKTLFKMASLDSQAPAGQRDYVEVYFK